MNENKNLTFSINLIRSLPGIGEKVGQEVLTFQSESSITLNNFKRLLDANSSFLYIDYKLVESDESLLKALRQDCLVQLVDPNEMRTQSSISFECKLEDTKGKDFNFIKATATVSNSRKTKAIIGTRKPIFTLKSNNSRKEIEAMVEGLFDVVKEDNVEMLEDFLTKYGEASELNICDENGMTLLHWAVQARALNCVKNLSKLENFNINATDSFGWTALHYAVNSSSKDIIEKILLNKNLKLYITTPQGKKAQDLAKSKEIAALLEAFTPKKANSLRLHPSDSKKEKKKKKEKREKKEKRNTESNSTTESNEEDSSHESYPDLFSQEVGETETKPNPIKIIPARSFKENIETNFAPSINIVIPSIEKPKIPSNPQQKFLDTSTSSKRKTKLFDKED